MARVLVALRDPLAALGLGVVLEDAPDLEYAGSVLRGEPIRSAVRRHRPRVLVLDVQHRRDDPSLLGDLAVAHPDARVLIMVDHKAEECALRHLAALRSGATLSPESAEMLDDCCLTSLKHNAHGCIPREPEPDMALNAIRTVAAGEIAAAPWVQAIADRVRNPSECRDARPLKAITPRELEVIVCLAEGLSNADIARRLRLSEQTVKNHVGKAMTKLGAESRLEIGLFASRHNVRLADAKTGPASN